MCKIMNLIFTYFKRKYWLYGPVIYEDTLKHIAFKGDLCLSQMAFLVSFPSAQCSHNILEKLL